MNYRFLSLAVLAACLCGCAHPRWDLTVDNATPEKMTDVSIGWDKHKITFGILGARGGKTHLYVSDVVGGRVPTNAVVQYTTMDMKWHKVSVDVPKTIMEGEKECLIFSIGEGEKVSVRGERRPGK